MKISYFIYDKISVDEFIDILTRSGLADRRPVSSTDILQKMLANANLIITARDEFGKIIGIARSITDFSYCCYLSCLAVDKEYQRKNIGKILIKKTLLTIGEDSMLLLLAAPNTEKYYSEKIGCEVANNAYIIKRGDKHKLIVDKLER